MDLKVRYSKNKMEAQVQIKRQKESSRILLTLMIVSTTARQV